MRIPLDYYRILGLPIQATVEQLQQAHRDRTLQLPRREFSEAAIESRKQLLDEAYAVLSDPSQRQEYDAGFLAKSYELIEVGRASDALDEDAFIDEPSGLAGVDPIDSDSYSPSINIEDQQFAGALLILHELGEYELVLKLGYPYLQGSDLSLKQGHFGDPEIILADIVLTVALACLELGREQWQQGQYENAAESLQTGQDILLREGFFPNIRGEMQADIYKLRPYRILELVALPEQQEAARQQGLDLLQDMLQDRNGIDGTGDDQSGLTVDDFLRFIQQLRSYLTVAEQQTLFEAEARRPSAVAVYLAVYALLARGFAERQPALIRRAKGMLLRLGARQDVHLEQAICSLLLGQTEEASRALELSQEFESLTFIREHSQGSPDLLPGLCLYSERWLQNEVFPHFRDLAQRQASLKEYFADEDVQAYLEELPNDPEPISTWSSRRSDSTYRPPTYSGQPSQIRYPSAPSAREQTPIASSTATATMDLPDYATANGAGVQTAERTVYAAGDGGHNHRPGTQTRVPRKQPKSAAPASAQPGGAAPRRTGGRSLRIDRILFLAAIGVGAILLLILLSRLFTDRSQPSTATSEAGASGNAIQPVQPLAPVLSQIIEQGPTAALGAPLNEVTAATILETWLSTKASAMGSDHDIDSLANILAEPALSDWQERAETLEESGSYWQYEHSELEIASVELVAEDTSVEEDLDAEEPETITSSSASTPGSSDSTDEGSATQATTEPQAAIVEATVTEQGEFYSNGQLDPNSSYESTLQVRYNLIQEDNQWRIESWEVLE
ncbi:MAG: IMS domain-containing protein [Elainellaceae cyanobacterium]